jgi:predicted Zn-dependent protease
MLRILLFCAGFGLYFSPGQAQAPAFSPVAPDAGLLASLHSQYESQYKDESNRLPSLHKKDYQECYKERWENIERKFTTQEIYTAADAQGYLDRLVAAIAGANPLLNGHPFHCYFSRSAVPNASYIGEGIILFNMGLFYRLADESQAVFILCHEIAHCYLQHPEKSIGKYVAAINSEEVQAQLRMIKGSEYQKRGRLESLVKGLTFDSRRHSRDHESEADSLAVILMEHTPFATTGALTTLALLDGIDSNAFDTENALRRTFGSQEYPFQKKWLRREEGLFGGHARPAVDKGMEDSLKTHPDCSRRLVALRPMIRPGGSPFAIDSARFILLQDRFRYEAIEYAFVSDRYTESLFLALQLLETKPGDVFLVSQTGRILNAMYAAQKAHRLGKVIDLPSPDHPENYDLLLQWVQNLHVEDIAAVSYYYLKRFHPAMDYYPGFKQSFEESKRNIQ